VVGTDRQTFECLPFFPGIRCSEKKKTTSSTKNFSRPGLGARKGATNYVTHTYSNQPAANGHTLSSTFSVDFTLGMLCTSYSRDGTFIWCRRGREWGGERNKMYLTYVIIPKH